MDKLRKIMGMVDTSFFVAHDYHCCNYEICCY